MTTQPKKDLPTHCKIRSTGRISTVLCEQVHSVAVERFANYIGKCSAAEMAEIDAALMVSLQLNQEDKPSKNYTQTITEKDEEIARLREKLEAAKGDASKRIRETLERMRAAGTQERAAFEEQRYKQAVEDLHRTEGQRDAYKEMYEQALMKLINGGVE